jgi:tRNA pseudouridine38-40 synthase
MFFPFKLDEDLLQSTAAIIPQYTQFESFSKRNTQSKTFNCTIKQCYWQREGAELHFIVEANRFLRGMVRGLVGTQLRVGRRKVSVDNFRDIIEAQNCSRAFFDVPGHGLYLEHVDYEIFR